MKQIRNKQMNHNCGYVISNGARIFYRTIGEGKPLLLLHGNGESYQIFKEQVSYFKSKFRLILIDTRGHGRSSMGHHKFTFHLFASDVLHVMDVLHIQKAYIIGFSDGANTALQFAIKYPKRLYSIALVSGNSYPKGLKPLFYYSVCCQQHFWNFLKPLSKKFALRQQLNALMAFEPRFSWRQLAHIKVPVLVLAGDHDVIRQQHTKAIAKAIPDSRLCLVKNADHMGMFKQPKIYNGLMEKFFLAN